MEQKIDPRSRFQRQTVAARQQAGHLLEQLIRSRDVSERRCIEEGLSDPMKTVTGRSAIEHAIASTREMIRNMDALIGDQPVTAAASVDLSVTLGAAR